VTFTYVGTLATDLDKLRFSIGDTSSTTGAGIKPDGTNFTDEELSGLMTAEGSWQRSVAGAFEILAATYARFVDITLGPRKEALSQASGRYHKMALDWRKKYGQAATVGVGSRAPIRIDGYSSDIASDEV
jgi:hypothetical protein